MSELSTVDIAQKQRHLHLLTKVKGNKALTAAELKELERYEQNMAKAKTLKGSKVKKKKSRKAGTLKGPKAKKISAAAVRRAAFECFDMAEAALSLGAGDLSARLAKNKGLKAAWERGRLLKNTADLAAAGLTIKEAAEHLQLADFAEMLKTDIELADAWNESRIKTIVEIKRAVVKKAKDGSPSAARQFADILTGGIVWHDTAIDYRKVTTNQLAAITGRSRQTVHKWFTEHGAPRNSDETYNLASVFEWFERFTIKKINAQPGRFRAEAVNPLTEQKVKKLQLENEQFAGRLIGRDEVLAGLLGRYQTIINYAERKLPELAMVMTGRPEKNIKILNGFFAELRKNMCFVPAKLKLSEKQEAAFMKLLQSIGKK